MRLALGSLATIFSGFTLYQLIIESIDPRLWVREMSYQEEFHTVELIRNSNAETRGVDAFALALIKAERQVRKLMTHLVFQFPCFSKSDTPELREVLANNRNIYFDGFIQGFDSICSKSIKELVGEKHDELKNLICESIEHRNKIFHGQLTNNNLSRDKLFLPM